MDDLALNEQQRLTQKIAYPDPKICGICSNQLPARPSASEPLCETCGAPACAAPGANCSCGREPTPEGACSSCGVPYGEPGKYWPGEEISALPRIEDFFPQSDTEEA